MIGGEGIWEGNCWGIWVWIKVGISFEGEHGVDVGVGWVLALILKSVSKMTTQSGH